MRRWSFMTKQKIFEVRWTIEKKVLKTIAGIAVFGLVCFNDAIADVLEDVMDAIGDFIYDYTMLGHSEVETIMAVTCMYLIVIGIDRFFNRFVPWTFKKMKKKSTQQEVSE
jgi:flagellar biosynthesis protein FlhB